MWSFAFLCTAIASVSVIIDEATCSKSNDLNIVDDILKSLHRQLQAQSKGKSNVDFNESEEVFRYGSWNDQDFVKSENKPPESKTVVNRISDVTNSKNILTSNELDLSSLLANHYAKTINSEEENINTYNTRGKKLLKPNDLTGYSSGNFVDESIDDLKDYSKVYIILNPQTLNKSKYKNNLSQLISKIVSSFSTSRANKQNRYEGYPADADGYGRRYMRDSRETGRDMEDSYRPKRSRSERGGGGGGGGGGGRPGGAGRTAIPYLGQRGDIYERDD